MTKPRRDKHGRFLPKQKPTVPVDSGEDPKPAGELVTNGRDARGRFIKGNRVASLPRKTNFQAQRGRLALLDSALSDDEWTELWRSLWYDAIQGCKQSAALLLKYGLPSQEHMAKLYDPMKFAPDETALETFQKLFPDEDASEFYTAEGEERTA